MDNRQHTLYVYVDKIFAPQNILQFTFSIQDMLNKL